MILPDVYLSLGGNIGDTPRILRSVLEQIEKLKGVLNLKISRFYVTSPVSDIPQASYVNAVCCFKALMNAHTLLTDIQKIEASHGKVPKQKNAPRIIDVDILFFGLERHCSKELEIPHPRWRERLFVTKPLSDLAQTIAIPAAASESGIELLNLNEFMQTFPNLHGEMVSLLDEISYKENYAFN